MAGRRGIDFRKNEDVPYVRYGIYPYNQVCEETVLLLPMPNGLESGDELDWADEDNWGIVAAGALGRGIDIAVDGYEGASKGSAGLSALKSGAWGAAKDMGAVAAKIGANAIGQVSPLAKVAARGKTLDLAQEQFFKGKAFRTFNFQHNLTPDNEEETEKIRQIIREFRLASSPSYNNGYFVWPSDIWPRFYTGGGGFNSSLRYEPSEENNYLPKIERSVLVSVQAQYQVNEPYQQHKDGSPTKVTIILQFNEMVKQTKEVVWQAENNGPNRQQASYTRDSLEERFSKSKRLK
tara:strand:+ start:7443 stop:8321 length:879 start_codon:yes stop_codon:yes gene_type:complete